MLLLQLNSNSRKVMLDRIAHSRKFARNMKDPGRWQPSPVVLKQAMLEFDIVPEWEEFYYSSAFDGILEGNVCDAKTSQTEHQNSAGDEHPPECKS